MFGESFGDMAGRYGFTTAVALLFLSYLVPRMFKARTEIAQASLQTADITARTDAIEMLNARVYAMEGDIGRLREQLEDERNLRVEAEDLVDKLYHETRSLRLRITDLENQIRAMGHEPL